jgi:diguanylate cyclase (GGDEF)-like protein
MGLLRPLSLFVLPAALIAAAFGLVFYSTALPESLAGLTVYGPYIVFAAGAALAAAFNRGRAFFAVLVLAAAYAAQQLWLQHPFASPATRGVYLALVLFVPLDLALLAALPERGILNRHGAWRLGLLGLQVAIGAWLASAGGAAALDWGYQKLLDPAPFTAGRIPQTGLILFALGALASAAAALITRSAVAAALAGAIVAFAMAVHVPNASVTFAAFTAMAALMLTIAVLQDTFRMAFRDELTGIPSRRALNEQLAGLGSRYTIAMADVDHFKKFNDTYGHDLGDQVLKMVASQLADVGGGGKAYRYGGEEFTLLFPGKEANQALPYIEALRRDIEAYRLALRGSDRPKKAKGSKRERGGWRGKNSVSVTISIGVAERNDRLVTPQAVIEAADRALYRAKDKGRNRVSR